MFSRFIASKPTKLSNTSTFVSQLQKKVKANQQFMGTIQKWRDIEIRYIGELMELQARIRDRIQEYQLQPDMEFLQVIETIVKSHKNSINKINYQIFQNCFRTFKDIIQQQRNILAQQKCQNKEFIYKKQGITKLRLKNLQLRKNLYQQLIQQIFCHNSVSQKKQKILKRAQEMNEKMDQHGLKIKQAKLQYKEFITKSKTNLRRFDNFQNNFLEEALDLVKKAKNNINFYAVTLENEVQNSTKSKEITVIPSQECTKPIVTESIIQKFQKQQQSLLKQSTKGYLQATIHLIRIKQIDQITQYTKDKQIKRKIKAVLQSTEIAPQFTDQITRQVQLVKKMLRTKDMSSMDQFRNIITKSTKNRLNYIFMLQLYRINSQFQMTQGQIQPIIILINELLKISHKKRDAFIIRQTIILLLTYYITIKLDDKQHKIFILQFFKKNKFWKDLQLWQSMLIECIYIQKKATLKMLVTSSCVNNNSQLAQAQRALVLSQILYIVKNMILFDFTQKQVKQFSNKFVRLLNLNDKFLKEVYNSIDNAMLEQEQNGQTQLFNLQKHQFARLVVEDDDGSSSS